MHLETSSNLFGTTLNPYNRNLTSGGSSGGEGALIALHGSSLGIGGDIGQYCPRLITLLPIVTPSVLSYSKPSPNAAGGSIRVPAANCGLYGLRPTTFRIPKSGVLSPHLGSGYISAVVGPLSNSLEGVKLFMRTVLGAKPWMIDSSLVPLPWKEGNESGDGGDRGWDGENGADGGERRSLRVGVMYTDNLVTPHPPIQRALSELVRKLDGIEGVELIEWHAWNHYLAWEFCIRFLLFTHSFTSFLD